MWILSWTKPLMAETKTRRRRKKTTMFQVRPHTAALLKITKKAAAKRSIKTAKVVLLIKTHIKIPINGSKTF